MRKNNFQKFMAALLALITVLGSCMTATVFATADFNADPDAVDTTMADGSATMGGNEEADTNASDGSGSSVAGATIDDIRELLSAVSYDEYQKKNANVVRADEAIVIKGSDYYAQQTDADVHVTDEYADNNIFGANENTDKLAGFDALYTPGDGIVSYLVNVPKTAKYSVQLVYYPVLAKSVSIERIFRINGEVPFAEARYLTMTKVWTNQYGELDEESGRRFKMDIDRNELRPTMLQTPEWRIYEFKDFNGFYSESFEFVLEEGENIISFEAVSEPMAIKGIILFPHIDKPSYAEIKEGYDKNGYTAAEKDYSIKIEAEETIAASSQTVYPIEDASSAITSPSDSSRTLLNTIGGEKWQTSGQWVRYSFTPEKSGLYNIVTRHKQSINDGLFSSRTLYIYGGQYNGLPFVEASQLRFDFSSDWCTGAVGDGNTTFEFYFEAGVEYIIEIEASLGSMGSVVRRVDNALTKINEAYLNIIKLTGANPDDYRDYGFSRIMPDTVTQLMLMSKEIYEISEYLTNVAGVKGSNIATLDRVAWLLEKMGRNENEIAKNLNELKTHIGNLGTWLTTAKTQPLQLDYIKIQSTEAEIPKANAGFFESFIYEIKKFFMSFVRNYDRMGTQHKITDETESIEVWLAYGRDQSQVLRTLVNNEFTPETGIPVDLKLVAAGTLLPSILAGMGPDVYIGLNQSEVINYAIRSAVLPIEDFDDFDDVTKSYNESAMIPLGIEDADGVYHCYGLPETQSFPMMFYRKDILADLNLDIPKTWDDILSAVPVLQANKMEIGLTADYKMFLYQKGGNIYADDGMRINLDSNTALDSFEMMCNMFTMYSFPYTYNFTNRFRTGEMPIGIADYSSTYNNLVVFATEIKGLWEFVPLPGMVDENGNINNVSISTITATVMIDGCDNKKAAWDFMKWYCGESCQIQYSNEMVALLGDSAKHPTANINALESLPWTTDELKNLKLQFNNLATIPNYPGYYYIDRYTNFAFLAAYNGNENPVTSLLGYINTINKEITRKRSEFGLETLEVGQTLADKRLGQAADALSEIKNSAYTDQIAGANSAIKSEDDIEAITNAANALEAADSELFATVVQYLRDAINALSTY